MASRSNPFHMGASDTLPAGYVIWFGSLDFVATGDANGTDILPSGANPDTPTPPSRRGRRPRRYTRGVRMARRGAERLALPPPHGSRQAGRSSAPRRRTPSPHHHRLRERLALPPPHGSRLAGRSPAPWRRTSPLHHHRLQRRCLPRRARPRRRPFPPGRTPPLRPTLHLSAPTLWQTTALPAPTTPARRTTISSRSSPWSSWRSGAMTRQTARRTHQRTD